MKQSRSSFTQEEASLALHNTLSWKKWVAYRPHPKNKTKYRLLSMSRQIIKYDLRQILMISKPNQGNLGQWQEKDFIKKYTNFNIKIKAILISKDIVMSCDGTVLFPDKSSFSVKSARILYIRKLAAHSKLLNSFRKS